MLLHSSEAQFESERDAFQSLQDRLPDLFRRILPDPGAPRTVVVVPSLTLDPDELAKIKGVHHYEERMLCMLMLLRLPRTRLVFLSSQRIHDTVVSYVLNLLPGVPAVHARRRLTMLDCGDASPKVPLTRKLLDRPELLERVRQLVGDPQDAHMVCFNATELERSLSVRLGVPLYGCDPDLAALGNKSGSREIFRLAGVKTPPGFEHLSGAQDMARALAELKREHPELSRAVVKLNEGFSGEGNATFAYAEAPDDGLESWITEQLPTRLRYEADGEEWESFSAAFARMGGIVEAFVDGRGKRSPSVQCRISPLAVPEIVSTHDQVLGGATGQVFLGCSFPANGEYRLDVQTAGMRVGEVLARKSVIGRFGVDFVSVPTASGWDHYAIEINLRKGGTTHPFMMLQFLTDGSYDTASGLFLTPTGQARFYFASDNVESEALVGLTPDALIDLLVCEGLHFHTAQQQGVVFHLLGATHDHGKLGVVCVADSRQAARALYERTLSTLTSGCGGRAH